MPDQRKYILWGALGLTALFFIEYFLHGYLPETIPGTNLKISGALIAIGIMVTFYILFRIILKKHPDTSIAYLVILGAIIVFISELIFQTYRQFTFEGIESSERVTSFLYAVFISTGMGALFALLEAVHIKYKNHWASYIVTICFIGLVFVISKYTGLFSFKFW